MIDLLSIAGGVRGGVLYGIGVGPGDVRLLTLRAAALIASVDVVASFAKCGRPGHARSIVAPLLTAGRAEMKLEYPVTEEIPVADPAYQRQMADFYACSAGLIADHLAAGSSVGLLAEGDPFFYGSFMHMWRRLAPRHPVEVVPGVCGMAGAWTRAGLPISWGDDMLSVLPGTLPEDVLAARLAATDAAVVMKLGRNLPKVRRALAAAGMLDRAVYVERATMADEHIVPLAKRDDTRAPYFSMVLVAGLGRRL
jgi:precorrin-2/cobalt-factor-2 C20-methyltransferase